MNGDIIAMAVGFILGAACAIIAIRVMFFELERIKTCEQAEDTRDAATEKSADEESKSRELLMRQWENFLVYDGTGNDQMPIGDE